VTKTFLALFVMLSVVVSAFAQDGAQGLRPEPGTPASQMPGILKNVSFDQRLNQQLPLDATLKDEDGRVVALGEYFGRKPVVLVFAYYECPMLCTQVLNGLASALTVLTESVSKDFEVVVLSFDSRETPALAAGKKKAYVDRYKRPGTESGWHFLTGDDASIRRVTDAAGFHYAWDDKTQQFAHASGIVVATPEGRLARYFFGIEYAPRDLKFALIESSAGRIGSAIDKLVLYCYHYDPVTGSYGFMAMNTVRAGGAITLLALVGFIVVALRRDATQRPV